MSKDLFIDNASLPLPENGLPENRTPVAIVFDKEYEDGTVESVAFTPEEIAAAREGREISKDEVDQALENIKQLNAFMSAVAAIVNLQRDVDRLNDNLARVFKELGHEHTWNKIVRD
jgi:hypothetical protein